MFSDSLKTLRKKKGFTQEELAARLKVVRQTVSKWEKGLSVPDAEMLLKIADIFEVSVSELLGSEIENEESQNDIAEQLSRINEQLVIKNRRARRVWKGIGIMIGLVVSWNIVMVVLAGVFPLMEKKEQCILLQKIQKWLQNRTKERTTLSSCGY